MSWHVSKVVVYTFTKNGITTPRLHGVIISRSSPGEPSGVESVQRGEDTGGEPSGVESVEPEDSDVESEDSFEDGGLTLSLLLAKNHIPSLIYEARPQTHT
ncbi:hypothetical protein HYALB_00010806 [Hymenoscyphus albidus]|uniref:Uncharacterized protein n=1 Tax=Hymenoscyphus albidus TaxID=595503 RepID=A0A9N9Q7G4_9HELO|nr:hypothetical protein HYALB_00010806 [Hymenoscyphus albidus]